MLLLCVVVYCFGLVVADGLRWLLLGVMFDCLLLAIESCSLLIVVCGFGCLLFVVVGWCCCWLLLFVGVGCCSY